ncbi:MAG: hypothetical protein ACYSR6_02385, partial [Planctomycetota bacterium]
SQRVVLSKAPVPSALLKTRRTVVKYSHNGWTNIKGQVNSNGRKTIRNWPGCSACYAASAQMAGGD